MVAAVNKPLRYKDLTTLLACDTANEECMLKWWDCTLSDNLRKHISNIFLENYVSGDDTFYTQRENTVRTNKPIWATVSRLYWWTCRKNIEINCPSLQLKNKEDNSKSLKRCSINESTCLIVLDFVEDCSFIVQGAVQGFLWHNSLCT